MKRNEFYEKLLSKPVGAQWTKEELAALPAATNYLHAKRAEAAASMEDLKKMAGKVTVGIAERKPYIDQQLPLNYAPHIAAGGKVHDGKDPRYPKGACIVDSWKTIRETVARANEQGEGLSYEQPFQRIK